jgi:hypothetical protein
VLAVRQLAYKVNDLAAAAAEGWDGNDLIRELG